MNFSSRLTDARAVLGLSQSELAKRCGVSREMWGKYERGIATPGGDVLRMLALTGADVGYILTGVRTPATVLHNMRLAAQITETAEMTPAQREAVRGKLGESLTRQHAVELRVNEPAHSYVAAHELRRDQRDLLDAYERCAPGARKAAIELLASAAQSQLDTPAPTPRKRPHKVARLRKET